MYLKRLELHGFKSFALRTVLEYSPGITAIVGPNGSGKCLEGSSLVTLADGRDLPIAQLVNTALEEASLVEWLDDGALTHDNYAGIQVLSLNPATLRLEAHRVAAFVRREAPPYLLRVRTSTGRQAVTTPYHPFFTLERGCIRTARAETLKIGVRLALPRQRSIENRVAAYHGAEQARSSRTKDCDGDERELSTSDIYWDDIAALEPLTPGEPWVYDLCVAAHHNFVAEGIIVHNSNVADGIRWVLGEQSLRQLRGKRSDDVIFVGGQGKPSAQMAEVGLVLDNSNGWLPSEYSEVTVTRRSFRAGDSEYLINGQRVRLKDVLSLLAQARVGHDSYTVIGQGLVDQALSLRAEERRGLFEDAAGIRQFQAQRNEAEQKLNLTQSNLTRLYDIIGEIKPRLAPLAEQARRAEDFMMVREELSRLLRSWYRRQWHVARSARIEAEAREQSLARQIEKLQDALAVEEGLVQELRQQRDSLLTGISSLRHERDGATSRLQAIERELAVTEERLASLDQQQMDLANEQEQQQEALDAALAHVGALESQVERAEVVAESSSEAAAMLERQLHTAVQEKERQEARLRAAQRDLIQVQTRLSAAQGELARLQRQLAERNRVLTARNETVAQALHKVETTGRLLGERQQLFEEARQEVEMLVAGREDLARGISEGQSALEAARAAVADNQRGRHAAMDRLALLEEWKSTLLGADDGARRLRSAPADADHPPIIGVLSELIGAPESFELAIEAALGPLLYALVVRTRAEAHQCADWLHRYHAGRAHILWTDVVHPDVSETTEAPVADNVEAFGFARDLVECATELHALLRRILGDTYVVRDLSVADYLWPTATPSFPVATLGGDVLHPDSWLLTASSQSAGTSDGATESSILARERELRQLPEQINQLDSTITKLSERLTSMVISQDERKQKAEGLHKELVRTEELAREFAKSVTGMQREQERAQSELQVNTSVAEQLLAELRDIEQEMSAINTRVLEHEAEQVEANDCLLEIQTDVDEVVATSQSQQEMLATARTTAALHQQEVRTLGQRAEQLRAQAHELEAQMNRRRQRLEAIELQRAELQERYAADSLSLAELRGRVRNLGEQLRERDTRQSDLERQIYQLERGQSSEREELARVEVEYRRSVVDSQQARDAILTLTQQMRDELESEEVSNLGESSQLSPILEIKDEKEEPVLTPEEAARLRRQIDQLRNRIKHLGGYDPEAPRAYEELKIRYDFMSSQVQDMEQASQNLRALIGELDTTMRRRFEETFHMVNQRFQRHFVTLFSGGSARLELTMPKRQQTEDDGDETPDGTHPAPKPTGFGGVEVFVQIPGKKVQDLSLLSGGERALVSAALLFALLETNPPPFCLLDEVDAALDEANVMRFCEILEQLAEQTQFIVITHNRVTMTHADAIYGISMGGDSISRLLSMRLADVRQGDLMGNSR